MDFLLKYKKILLALAFLLVIILLGYLIYALFFKSFSIGPGGQPAATSTPGTGLPQSATGTGQQILPGDETGLPSSAGGAQTASPVALGGLTETTPLNQSPSLGATLSGNGTDLQYYDEISNKFYRIDKDGQAVALSEKIFHDVDNVVWSPDKNQAIIEYPDGANIIYNFATNKQVTLPTHWEGYDFSPEGSKIVLKSIGLDPDNRWLAVSSPDGSDVTAIESLGENGDAVITDWSPNNQIIATFSEGLDFDRQEVFFVGLNHENFKSTIVEGRGFQPKWSPDGKRLLYSVYSSQNNMKPNLWVVDASGENIGNDRKNLSIETWADKCTYASTEEIYCAVPQDLPEGAGLFPDLAKSSVDRLFKINTKTGLKKLVAVPDGTYNMSNLIISDNGYYLYFTDETTKRLYQIKLK